MERGITVIPQLCTGCEQCALTCSFVHESVYAPSLSRVKVVKFADKCLNVPVTCAYCEQPVCEEVCPVQAITHDPITGSAKVAEDICLGCKECVNACPLGAIEMHPQKGIAMRCDLCGGDPSCVKQCPAGALRYEPLEHAVSEKRRARVVGWNLE